MISNVSNNYVNKITGSLLFTLMPRKACNVIISLPGSRNISIRTKTAIAASGDMVKHYQPYKPTGMVYIIWVQSWNASYHHAVHSVVGKLICLLTLERILLYQVVSVTYW